MTPLVSIIMGSDSDLHVMKEALGPLKNFGIPYEVQVVSAHRGPEGMQDYALSARSRGIEVIIAGAGGAAHLPGMVASLTTLPVIGVPVALKHLSGLDSILSILQMPKGVPVATVSVDNAQNAGILALRILSLKHTDLLNKLEVFRDLQKDKVEEMNQGLAKQEL